MEWIQSILTGNGWLRLPGWLIDLDKNVISLAAEWIRGNGTFFRRVRDACVEIESPGVPRANNRFSFNPALAQWTLSVGTDVAYREEFSVEVGEADLRVCDRAFGGLAGLRSFA
jgi:hypothetical protein